MPKKSTRRTFGFIGFLISLFTLLGLYRLRRRLIAGWLRLRPPRHNVIFNAAILVPMPDGAGLATDHYAPASMGRLYPTILIRTPYGRNPASGPSGLAIAFAARRFAERGYNVLVQDVRGRYDSPGEFAPFFHEAEDGRATLDWLEKQPWFNGVLGMWGPSYLGYVQWAVASGAPLYLKALMPIVSGSQLAVLGIRDGALAADMLLRWVYGLESTQKKRRLGNWLRLTGFDSLAQERAIARATKRLPVGHMDKAAVGYTVPFFQDWVEHPSVSDAYWRPVLHTPKPGAVTAAVHLVGGWHDILLRETLADYEAMLAAGSRPYLTIGPWAHTDLALEKESLRQGLAWFDAHLKGDRRNLRQSPVLIYVMGVGHWREMERWPPQTSEMVFFLGRDGVLAASPEPDTPPDRYIYHPDNPTPALGGALMSRHAGVRDNRWLEARKDVLTYTSSVLNQDLEVIGAARLNLYAYSSQEYTDFFARLCDVEPNGRSLNVCDGFMRVAPEVGSLQPDGSKRLTIELWPTAYRFRRGHRLRLQLSSGAHPRWTRNTGSGEPLATASRLLPVEQSVFHDHAHPSGLILPVTSVKEG